VHRLPLPLVVGSANDCDVIVNAPSLAGHAYTLRPEGRSFAVESATLGRDVPAHALNQLGLEVVAVAHGDADKTGMRRAASEKLAREAVIVQKLPAPLKVLALGFLPQRARLAVWGAAAAGLLALGLMPAPEEAPIDNSGVPVTLAWDTIRPKAIGANPASATFPKGYEHGITFAVDAPEVASGEAALLTFLAAGLNVGGEVEIDVNGTLVYTSDADRACATDACAKAVRLPKGLITAGANVVRVVHKEPKSAYLLADIHLRSTPAATQAEVEQAELWLSLAQRAFDERNIMPENLITARKNAEAVVKLAKQKEGVEGPAAKAEALLVEVEKDFAAVTAKIWNDVAIAERINKLDDAEKSLDQLLRLYPDQNSTQAARVRQKKQVIKELKAL